MTKLVTIFALLIMLASCGPSVEPLKPNQIKAEEEEITEVIMTYNKASEDENFAGILPTLADNVNFFGTDSADVIKNLNDFKKKMTDQFNEVDKMKYGEMTDVFIQMDPYGNFASIIYGLPLSIEIKGVKQDLFLRGARTLKKEDGRWVIVSGIIGVAGGTEPAAVDTIQN